MLFRVAAICLALALAGCAAPTKVPPPLAASFAEPYQLGPGDTLRVTVFGQTNLSNRYIVDAAGRVTMPLIGPVPASGSTTAALAKTIEQRLRNDFIREPNVSVEIEAYRPFFILGEVTNAGQFAYVADMTAENAVAIAGGFTPRAYTYSVIITRRRGNDLFKGEVPLTYPIRPGDTLTVQERWF
jgi:polysaccharide export outer membrane protein